MVLGQDEVAKLINAARTLMQRALLMVLYGTGLRRAEIAMLKVSNIDSSRMTIHVEFAKGENQRFVPLSSTLHTWGQNLQTHPHIHCAIPQGGLAPDHKSWIHPRHRFFVPVKVLSKVFRGKFLHRLMRLYRKKKLRLEGPAACLQDEKCFAAERIGLSACPK